VFGNLCDSEIQRRFKIGKRVRSVFASPICPSAPCIKADGTVPGRLNSLGQPKEFRRLEDLHASELAKLQKMGTSRDDKLRPSSLCTFENSLIWVSSCGLRYYMARDYSRAIDQNRNSVELDPNFAAAHLLLGEDYLGAGLHSEAVNELKKAANLSGDSPLYTAQVAVALAVDRVVTHSESRTTWKRFRGTVTFPLTAWLKSTRRQIRKRTHSNSCKLPTTITLLGWDTSRSTLFLTDIAQMSALRIFFGASACA